ncbi:hypothetical protein ACPEIC_46480 [Stenotrophomonas sp. NPDC087984]
MVFTYLIEELRVGDMAVVGSESTPTGRGSCGPGKPSRRSCPPTWWRSGCARREYSTHEFGIEPEVYDPKLDVDFTQLRGQGLNSAGFGQAA